MFFQKDIETMSRKDIEALQLERLKRVVKYCYDNVPFYHKRMDEVGFDPAKVRVLSDIEYMPYTTKEDARALVDEHNARGGVSKAQEAAMAAGSMFGFDVPAADPANYDENGQPIKPKHRDRGDAR